MLRALLPLLLLTLGAAPAVAQKARTAPNDAAQEPSPRLGGVRSDTRPTAPAPKRAGGGVSSTNPAPGLPSLKYVAAMRARHEKAKANGQLDPRRMERQARRLAQAEAMLAAHFRKSGVFPSGKK
jgi:hypothetical protein